MACIVRRHRPHAWATACVLTAAVAAIPAFARPSDARGFPGAASPATHESSAEEVVQSLWEAYRGTERAVETGDLEAAHQGEAAIDEALHALAGKTQSLLESRRERAHELLDQCFEIVDALHEAAEAGDARALEQLVRELETLIAELQTLFHVASAVGVQTSVRMHHTFHRF